MVIFNSKLLSYQRVDEAKMEKQNTYGTCWFGKCLLLPPKKTKDGLCFGILGTLSFWVVFFGKKPEKTQVRITRRSWCVSGDHQKGLPEAGAQMAPRQAPGEPRLGFDHPVVQGSTGSRMMIFSLKFGGADEVSFFWLVVAWCYPLVMLLKMARNSGYFHLKHGEFP